MVLQSIILFNLKDSQKSPLSNFVWCDSESFLNKDLLLKEALLRCVMWKKVNNEDSIKHKTMLSSLAESKAFSR